MEVYLDNSATTKVDPRVQELIIRIMQEDYGNAASLHRKGVEAEKYVREAKEWIGETLKVDPKTIFFTSGGTESNNWALIGTATANQRSGKHLITTSVEHPSIKNTMKYLESIGFEVTYLPVDHDGILSLDTLKNAIREDTTLVSVMAVNNEIGALEPIDEIGEMLHKEYPHVIFHVDAIQAYGKIRIYPKRQHIDLLSVSGHKLYGPKGSGFLYIDPRVKIRPLIFGGDQQKGMRSGTENVPGEAGIGLAAKLLFENFDQNVEGLYARKFQLINGLETIEGTVINGKKDKNSAPQIVSCRFDGIRSEVLLHALEDQGIYVSSGSACSSAHPSEANTLLAIGLDKAGQEGTIRFSFSNHTTEEEIDYTIEKLREIVPMLRKYTRR